jgi:hypothetical protein
VDEWDEPIAGATVGIQNLDMTVTDAQGIFSFVSTKDFNKATVTHEGYRSSSFLIPSRDHKNIHNIKFI